MTATEGILAFTFASGLVQGGVLGPAVATLRGVNRRATGLLSAIILCLLPLIAEEFVSVAGLLEQYPHTLLSSTTTDFLLAPLLFLYARSISAPERRFTRADLWHLAPFLITTAMLLPFFTLSGAEKLATMRTGAPSVVSVIVVAKLLVAGAYLTLAISHARQAAISAKGQNPHATWFLRCMLGLAVVVLAMLVLGISQRAGVLVPIDSDSLGTLFVCGSLYLVCLLLIRHPFARTRGAATETAATRPKYGTSPLTADEKDDLRDRLVECMLRERPFLDVELSLERLAGMLNVPPSHLSQVLNETLAMNFYEFINSYRVQEARRRIADPATTNRTLLSIAYESGFNSKASFNRAFKRMTGLTPSDYARSVVSR